MGAETMKKILVVDDEPSILTSLGYALRTDGVEVIACSEIEQAEEALARGNFDLVITDIRMSGVIGIEGLELLTYIKERYDTEVIIMTGYGSSDIETEAYRRGAYHYYSKPVDIVDLLDKVAVLDIPTRKK